MHSRLNARYVQPASLIVSPESLLRLSVGLENADDLIDDLDQALG